MRKVLGIDIGGVIIDRSNDDTDTSFFSDNYLATTATDKCFISIKTLVDHFGPENVYIVSKAGKNTERKSREWLKHHNFYEMTGMKEENLRFCRERIEKTAICRDLNVTHFVDDRLDVLEYMEGVVPHRFLFGPRPASWEYSPGGISSIVDWVDMVGQRFQ